MTRPTIIAALCLALGCAKGAPVLDPLPVDEPALDQPAAPVVGPTEMEDFVDSVVDLQATFGADDKMDLISRAEVCQMIAPVAKYGDALVRSGFVMGIEGTAVVGMFDGFGGYDLVCDLYHQQFTVSKYGGSVQTMDELAITATAYVGYAAGFRTGVSDWHGYHVQASLEVGLPFLDDLVSLEITGFRSAIDQNNDGVADASEVLMPPDGLFGYTVGITAGIDAFPDPLPVEVTLSDGYWDPHKQVIRTYYERFKKARFLGIKIPIKVRLVDTADGSECHPDWPEQEEERDCAVEFGDPDTSHTRRSIHLARSLCTATYGCALPVTWPVAGSAIAVGKLRDMGLAPSELCPGIEDPLYAGNDLPTQPPSEPQP